MSAAVAASPIDAGLAYVPPFAGLVSATDGAALASTVNTVVTSPPQSPWPLAVIVLAPAVLHVCVWLNGRCSIAYTCPVPSP